MSLAELVMLALRISIIVMVFALGLTVKPRDLMALFRRPTRLAVSFLSMFGVMLVAASAAVRLLDLPLPADILMVALALSPVPPLLPNKQAKAGVDSSYAVGLAVAASLFSLLWIPLALPTLNAVFQTSFRFSPVALIDVVAVNLLIPIALGAVLARLAPAFAARIQPLTARVGLLLLVTMVLLVLFRLWKPMLHHLSDGTAVALAAFVVVGLVVGHLLGGPDPDDRSVLAIASAARHPGIAMALATLNFPDETSMIAVVFLYLLISAVISAPYVLWRKRVDARHEAASASRVGTDVS